MSRVVNRQVRLARRPEGPVRPGTWRYAEEPVPELEPGTFLARTRTLSLDPAMRGWLDARPSYLPPVGVGEVMRAHTAVEVVASRHDRYAPGDHLTGMFGVQTHVVSDGVGARRADLTAAPLTTHLGALGLTGMTAYFGLLEVGALRPGDTVAVSGAAGAVGTVVGQLAKVHGCRVIGVAGGPGKCGLLTRELGFDAAIDHRSADLRSALRESAPEGIDVVFDNVGGPFLEAGLANLTRGARVVLCGAISRYDGAATAPGPTNYMALLVRRARMEGFVVLDYAARFDDAVSAIGGWIADGRLVPREHVLRGDLEAFPAALDLLFAGGSVGKLVLDLDA